MVVMHKWTVRSYLTDGTPEKVSLVIVTLADTRAAMLDTYRATRE